MYVGAFYFPTDYGIAIDELARELESRGFESLFVCEHTHIPVSRRTPFPGGGELPKRYSHTHDPFVALSFAAAATRTLKLGTGIALLPQRDTIITAKSVASLDQLSGGRFIFAIGGGWNAEEMENHGVAYESRFKLLRERTLAMKALWTQQQAEFHGKFVDLARRGSRACCSKCPTPGVTRCYAGSTVTRPSRRKVAEIAGLRGRKVGPKQRSAIAGRAPLTSPKTNWPYRRRARR
jgi:probable F420-dependent oxidoreductase